VHSHKPDWLLARQSQQQGRPGGPQPVSDRGPYSVLAVAYAGQGTREAVALVDAADQPLAAEHAVIDIVFVSAGAEAGGAELEGHHSPLLDGVNRVLTID
jgi:hypothetical protein